MDEQALFFFSGVRERVIESLKSFPSTSMRVLMKNRFCEAVSLQNFMKIWHKFETIVLIFFCFEFNLSRRKKNYGKTQPNFGHK